MFEVHKQYGAVSLGEETAVAAQALRSLFPGPTLVFILFCLCLFVCLAQP